MLGRALFWPGHFGATTLGFFGLYPSSCQSPGFVSLAGKASLVSISDAVLLLRSQYVCLPLEFEFRGKSCVFIDLYLVFPTNFRIVFLPYTNTVILQEPYYGIITETGLPVLLGSKSQDFCLLGVCKFAFNFCHSWFVVSRPSLFWAANDQEGLGRRHTGIGKEKP